jgi:SAM-dependent methyltransferase
MSSFGQYASYYDLVYRDKDYRAEAGYVAGLIRRYSPKARTLLEMGCGTGLHATHLAEQGFAVLGVDLSEPMVERARAQRECLAPALKEALEFTRGDIRHLRLNRTFDAVIALFHVMSYQTGNEDLQGAFTSAAVHLEPGGLLVFDCWYGPGVLTDRPAVRVKRMEDERIRVTRLAEPVMHANENVVDVHYEIHIEEKASGQVGRVRETHRMRYLFAPEVRLFLAQAGFEPLAEREWMSDKELGFSAWGACFVARKL